MSAGPKRRFQFWSICLIIAVVCASIVFVARLARKAPEPFVSVNFIRTNAFGTPFQRNIIQVSNRMSFKVNCSLRPELLSSGQWMSLGGGSYYSLAGHSQQNAFLYDPPSEGKRLTVSYERRLMPIESLLLNKFPWLKQHGPFNPGGSFAIYEWKEVDSSNSR